jgi:hypothetical protein
MKHLTPLILLCTLIISGCGGVQKNSGPLPVIDLTAQYPKKDVVLQEIADVEYISLNGKDTPLMGTVIVALLSDDCYILKDYQTHDVFVLEKNGTVRCHFNMRGNSGKEYTRISQIAYDAKKREIYILDAFGPNCILVYSETGTFLRSFPEYSRRYLNEIYDYDDNTLLAYFKPTRPKPDSINHTSPYVFLSKKDGAIVERMNLRLPKRLSHQLSIPLDDGQVGSISITTMDDRKYGDEFVIADISADTLYTFSKKGGLTPVLARSPSVHAQDPFVAWSVGVKTDRFITISAFEYDFEKLKQQMLKNQPMGGLKSTEYLYYINSQEIVIPKFTNADWTSVSKAGYAMNMGAKNMGARIFQAEQLVEALEKGELSGKLKEVAQTLTYDDNPVLMVVRYK